jgi:hypothetical protein
MAATHTIDPVSVSAGTTDGGPGWNPFTSAADILGDVGTVTAALDHAGADRAPLVAFVAQVLTAEDRLPVLVGHTGACRHLVGHVDVAEAVLDAVKGCSASCRTRVFWQRTVAEVHGHQFVVWHFMP